MQKMNSVVHFEIPAHDRERVRKFCESAFGWQTSQLGPEMGDYVIATTTETDEKRMIKTPGAINGGMYQRPGADQRTRLTIGVEDIYAAMKRVEAAGGKVIGGMQQPG